MFNKNVVKLFEMYGTGKGVILPIWMLILLSAPPEHDRFCPFPGILRPFKEFVEGTGLKKGDQIVSFEVRYFQYLPKCGCSAIQDNSKRRFRMSE